MADKETEQIKKLNQTVHSKDTRERDQAYNEYVKQVTPTHNLIFHMVKAFFTGGIICCIGQFILNTCENYGLDKDTSGGWCSMLLILAIEFQKEGQVFGIGCKIFTIAGPVILYGIVSSWVLGLIYWMFW